MALLKTDLELGTEEGAFSLSIPVLPFNSCWIPDGNGGLLEVKGLTFYFVNEQHKSIILLEDEKGRWVPQSGRRRSWADLARNYSSLHFRWDLGSSVRGGWGTTRWDFTGKTTMPWNPGFRNLICGASLVLSLPVTLSVKWRGQSECVPLLWCVLSLWTSLTPRW